MTLLGYGLIWFGLAVEALLLWRMIYSRLIIRYPFFSAYFLAIVIRSFALLVCLKWLPHLYLSTYWPSSLACSLLWFAVAWEVFHSTFPRGSSARRFAAATIAILLFFLAGFFFYAGNPHGVSGIYDITRKVSLAVDFWLVLVIAFARYGRLPLGRNIWGMAAGLMVYMSTELINFAAVELSRNFMIVWEYVKPISFIAMLLIWLYALWNYAPNPSSALPREAGCPEDAPLWRNRWNDVEAVIRRAVRP